MIIYNNIIPFKGFKAINLFGVIFARKECEPLSERTINHERIHTRQMLELFVVGFYVWYIVEWLIKLLIYKDRDIAYRNICFEREAYQNSDNLNYLASRKPYQFIKNLKI